MKKGAVELVFIPSPGIGHLVATVEIAKLLVGRDDQLHITVLIMKLPFESKGTDAYTQSSNSISQRINFINLPEPNIDTKGLYGLGFFKVFIEAHKPHVRDAVAKLVESGESKTRQLAGLVVDMFCTTMIDVADEFGVPSYVFFTSNAGCLGLLLHLEKLRDKNREDVTEFMRSGGELVFPSFANPLPTTVLPSVLLEKEGATHFLDFSRRFPETKGILVNSFMELESHALRTLSDGTIPPVYSVGPILNKSDDKNQVGSDKARQKSDIFEWLDDQPPTSVVFLCFGSMGCFGEDQVKEIACALEHSGLRFLWSLREPPPKDKMGIPSDYANPERVLPEGFLDRTAGIGKVIGWAPQVDILAHPAVGGFVSHCGWNSLLESLWYGVPVATWPMYAEQQLNAFEMVKELELAVEIDMHFKKDGEVVVSAQDIERGIRQVMEIDSDIRKRVKKMSEKSKKALMDGGSSYSSLGHFIHQIYI